MILIDAGPLAALVDAGDQHHRSCLEAFKQIHEQLLATVWPAFTEAMYLMGDEPDGQEALWEFLERGVIEMLPLGGREVPRMLELMRKYRDRSMDMADAALVTVAERENIRTIFTTDKSDFRIYRIRGRQQFTIIP